MLSKVHICNLALLAIGTRSISSLEERTPEAVYCAQHYDLALEETLRDHPWNFAQSRQRLAKIPMPDEWAREYAYAYAYPANCLHLHTLITEAGNRSQAFAVAQHQGQNTVLSHIDKPIAAYTARITDPSQYDPLFARALGAKMACHLVQTITKSGPSAVQAMEKLYASALAKAKTADAREGQPYNTPDTDWNGGHGNPWVAARLGVYRK